MNEIYTPMEKILIQAAMLAQAATEEREPTKDIVEAALETKEKTSALLELDLMLCQAEEKMGLLDGIPIEGWIASEVSE